MNWVHDQWEAASTLMEIQGEYSMALVVLSILIASAAAFISFYLIDILHRQKTRSRNMRYLVLVGAILGTGIWTLHFIGMLAFRLPVSVSYDLGITLLSVLPSFLASTPAVYFLVRKPSEARWILVCGTLMAVAIATMHYTGMMAMRIPGQMAYDPWLFTASIIAGLVLSPLALVLRPLLEKVTSRTGAIFSSAVGFGLVIAIVHYTAMSATRFYVPVSTLYESTVTPVDQTMVGMVSAAAIGILIVSLVVSLLDQKLFAARSALEKTASRMEAVVDSIGEAIFVFSRDGSILSANSASWHVFAHDEGQRFGSLAELMAADDSSAILSAIKAMSADEEKGPTKIMGEVKGRRMDGSEFPMDMAISCLPTEEDRLVAVCGDATDRKLAAEKAEAQRDKLECLLAERTEKLENTVRQLESEVDIRRKAERTANLAREEAELANRSKSEFLANVSHELRTPLNAIIGFSEILMDERLSRMADQQNYLQDIHSSGRHLLSIINDILDLAKVEAGRVTLEEAQVPLDLIVETATHIVKERIHDAGLELSVHLPDEGVMLYGDERKLKQLLLNLLSNSIKFTEQGGTITIGAGTEESGFVLSVRDTGIGMSPEDRDRVMDPFVQVDSSKSRAHEGTGLGLSIARSFAELHGGTLSIESEEGKGTCVTLVLPMDRVHVEECLPVDSLKASH